MALSRLKATRSRSHDGERKANSAPGRFTPERPDTRLNFRAQTDPATDYWRTLTVIAVVATGVAGVIVATGYFIGLIAAAIMAAAVGGLIAFGNWILDHTIDLL